MIFPDDTATHPCLWAFMVDFCASFAASSKKRKSEFEQGKFIVFYFLGLYSSTPGPFNFPGDFSLSLGNFRENIDSMK